MPVSEDRLYQPDSINRWFAISGVLMLLSFLWLVLVDYDRPWRDYQYSYYTGKAALAHLDFLDATRQEKQQEVREAEQRLEDAQRLLNETKADRVEQIQSELVSVGLEFAKVDGPLSRAKQVLDVTKDAYERAKEKYGPDHPQAKAAHDQLKSEEERIENLRRDAEHWEDRKRELEGQLRDISKDVREAETRVRTLKQVAETALAKDQAFRGVLDDDGLLGGIPIVKTIINMPLLDFVAPKNTPGRGQVNQVVLPHVRQRLNYLESYTTDRCTTCHVAIGDPEFSRERLAARIEKAIPGVNEELQRRGQAAMDFPAPPVLSDPKARPLAAGEVASHWNELSRKQQDEYFDALLATYNKYLTQTGRKTIELGQPVLAHPDLDLYLSVDSPHPLNSVGCTVCHEGNPQETDFVFAAHAPRTHEVQQEWEDLYYQVRLGVPQVTFETMAHFWDRPMRLPEHTEAGCAKCHSGVADVAKFRGERHGERINLGQQLFIEAGCINCHNVEVAHLKDSRRVGPDLTRIASKLAPEFIEQWVWFPQKFRPSTRMPHFFMQENNNENSGNRFDPEPTLRTETEVAAATRYLLAVSSPWKPLEKPADVTGDVDRGRALFKSVGCGACHANVAEYGEEWITRDLVSREGINPENAGFRYKGMTYEERVRYAMDHFANEHESYLQPDKARFEGGEPPPPTFTRFAPELSAIGSKVNADWLYSWLREPSHFSAETKMPSLRLSPQEASDVTAYLMSLKHDSFEAKRFELTEARRRMADELIFTLLSALRSERRSRAIMNDEGGELSALLVDMLKDSKGRQAAYDLVSGWSLEEKKLAFLGNKTILHYGCYACHTIPGFEQTTPPGTDLSGWAEKPIAQLDFAFYDHAFHDLRHEKDDVFGYLYPSSATQLRRLSPMPDDAREQVTHTHAAFAKHKMLNPRIWDRQKIKKPYDKLKMPNFYFTEEEADALTTFLLSRVPPRVEGSLPVNYDESLKGPIARGRMLTRQLNCVGCHQVEDNVPTVQQYFRRTISGSLAFDETNAPPNLRGEGAKIQHQWLHGFLTHVETLRPWLQIRMPSFKLTQEESTAIIAYFASLNQNDARALVKALTPVGEYVDGASASKEPEVAEHAARWFEQESLSRFAEELRDWAMDTRLMRRVDLDPLRTPEERFRAAHAQLLDRTRFMARLYDVEYPFVEPPSPLSEQERFDRGMKFVGDMGCLKCHVMGNMVPGPAKNLDEFIQVYRLDGVRGEGDKAQAVLNGVGYPVGATIDGCKIVSASNTFFDSGDVETKAIVEGPNAQGVTEQVVLVAASAPNLGLTYARLRREWVHQWMLEPQWIQPGTKMPQNFGGGKSPFEGDPNYPGTSEDHINLLVDTLYDAGRRNARMPIPKVIMKAKSEEFEEDGEAEEFEE